MGNSMEQLRALAGLGDPLKLSIEWVFPRGLTPATASSPTRAASAPSSSPRCCPVDSICPSHAAEMPERLALLVGATQTDVFRRDVFGDPAGDLRPRRGRRVRKETPRRRGTKKRAEEEG